MLFPAKGASAEEASDTPSITVTVDSKCEIGTKYSNGKESKFYTSNRHVAGITKKGSLMAFNEGECNITIIDNTGAKHIIKITVVESPKVYKQVALTFDDGPGAYSEELLDYLAEKGAKVTFFVIGENVVRYPSSVKRMLEEGHEVGNHSYTHPNLKKLSEEKVQKEISKTNKAIYEATGEYPTVMRPPYGSYNDTVRKVVGLPVIVWSVDTLDWKYRDADYVAEQVIKGAKDGEIILVHEIHKTTIQGIKKALDKLCDEGYEFVTVTELLTRNGAEIGEGKVYSRLKKTE